VVEIPGDLKGNMRLVVRLVAQKVREVLLKAPKLPKTAGHTNARPPISGVVHGAAAADECFLSSKAAVQVKNADIHVKRSASSVGPKAAPRERGPKKIYSPIHEASAYRPKFVRASAWE
jgi:hypothetical protein